MFLNFSGVVIFRMTIYTALIKKMLKRVANKINTKKIIPAMPLYLMDKYIKAGNDIGNTVLQICMKICSSLAKTNVLSFTGLGRIM